MKLPRSYEEDLDSNHRHNRRRFSDRPIDDNRRRFDHGGGGGGDNIRRSESFSTLRRDYPKGFRSDRGGRDRFMREGSLTNGSESGSGSSSWQVSSRRLSSEREVKRTSFEKEKDNSIIVNNERREREERNVDCSNREICSSSSEMEMEEGELQPEPDPVPEKCKEAEIKNVGGKKGNISNDKDEENVSLESKQEDLQMRMKVDTISDTVEKRELVKIDSSNDANYAEKNPVDYKKTETKEDNGNTDAVVEKNDSKDYTNVGDEVSLNGVQSDAKVEMIERTCIDLEAEPVGRVAEIHDHEKTHDDDGNNCTTAENLDDDIVVCVSDGEVGTLDLMTDKPQDSYKDKGKSIAIPSLEKNSSFIELGDSGEGSSSGRGFALLFPSHPIANSIKIESDKDKDDNSKFESLNLSLGLPGILSDQPAKQIDAKPNSPSREMSFQSLPSSFRTMSDGFTNSISFSGSQSLVHNPSCSLLQNSDNFEQSVKSRPLFQGVFDQNLNEGTVWRGQTSNDHKSGGGSGSLFQKMIMNGNPTTNSIQPINGHQNSNQNSLQRQLSQTHSHGLQDIKSEQNKDTRLLSRERSSSCLLRNEQHDGDKSIFNGDGSERVISKIVSEPLQFVCRLFREMPDQSITHFKEVIHDMFRKAEKHGKLHAWKDVLEKRSDFNAEALLRCPQNLLEILVTLKTGLPDFLSRAAHISSSDLVDIFFNLKCRNLSCNSMLPVDDCDCKICTGKCGFCRDCMCLVCSKFDNASNTCGWVGCDMCLHWCHTDCGLRDSYIRNGNGNSSGVKVTTVMQFHCVACGHPSEMFGFVKDVFKTCAKNWNAETLVKELQYVRKIFASSNDVKGKTLCALAEKMLQLLGDKANLSQVIDYILGFFSESEANTANNNLVHLAPNNAKESSNAIITASSSKEALWLPSTSHQMDRIPQLKHNSIFSNINHNQTEPPVKIEKKPIDELENVVMCKQAEAKMYQERADTAKREAESLKRIAAEKNAKIEEEYSTKIAKLQLLEAEERRRQKLEEFQAMERAHREFFNMKMRMQSDITTLLQKMESVKRNFDA